MSNTIFICIVIAWISFSCYRLHKKKDYKTMIIGLIGFAVVVIAFYFQVKYQWFDVDDNRL